jgi:hypothetical protein
LKCVFSIVAWTPTLPIVVSEPAAITPRPNKKNGVNRSPVPTMLALLPTVLAILQSVSCDERILIVSSSS